MDNDRPEPIEGSVTPVPPRRPMIGEMVYYFREDHDLRFPNVAFIMSIVDSEKGIVHLNVGGRDSKDFVRGYRDAVPHVSDVIYSECWDYPLRR